MKTPEQYPATSESELTSEFSLGDTVSVPRNIRDPETGLPTGETVIEPGWKVEDIAVGPNGEAIVTVQLPELDEDPLQTGRKLLTKRYRADQLIAVQNMNEHPSDTDDSFDLGIAASKSLMNLENKETQAIPEIVPELEHIQEELGEVALEEAEIEEPQPDAEENLENRDETQPDLEIQLEAARREYEVRHSLIRDSLSVEVGSGVLKIEEASESIQLAKNLINGLESEQSTVLRIVAGYENGNYDTAAVHTLLMSVSETLTGTYARMKAVEASAVPGIKEAVRDIRESIGASEFELQKHDAAYLLHTTELIKQSDMVTDTEPTLSSDEIYDATKALDEPLEAIGTVLSSVDSEVSEQCVSLQAAINLIDQIKQESYNGTVDVQALQGLAARLHESVDNAQRLNTFDVTVSESLTRFRVSLSTIKPV